MNRHALLLVPVLTLAACGMPVTAPDVAAYQLNLSSLTLAVSTHQDAGVATTAQDCAAEHQRYDGAARPALQHMLAASQGMDDCLQSMGHSHGMRSGCGSMQSELDRHAGAACSPDAGANHAEVTHHCRLMRDWLSQQHDAADGMEHMGGMMDAGHCGP